MKRKTFFLISIILIFIDQISKYFIVINKEVLPKTIIKNILDFTYCENRGIAFGIGSGHVLSFSVITGIAIIFIIIAICMNYKKIEKLCACGISIFLAGGIGNFIDRTFRGYVIDFIDFGNFIRFPIFNFADICVVLGVIIIGIYFVISIRGEKFEENNC